MMKHSILLAGMLCGLLFARICPAEIFVGVVPANNAIPDGTQLLPGNYGQPLDVSFDVANLAGTVSNVEIAFTGTHGYVGDLRVTLIAPNGKDHLLFARTRATTQSGYGSSYDLNGNYNFRDSAPGNWWTIVDTGNPVVPSGNARTVISGGAGVSNPAPVTSLNTSFSGIPAEGRWILRFEDGSSTETGSVSAATLTLLTIGTDRIVTNANDAGAGSLRDALLSAANGDRIKFDMAVFNTPKTIRLQTALPTIHQILAIEGPGANLLNVRRDDTAPEFRIFLLEGDTDSVSLSGMTISNGRTSNYGGGIYGYYKPLTLSGVHVTGNQAGAGGGVAAGFAGGTYINSTVSGNISTYQGGGFSFQDSSSNVIRMINCTISGNRTGGAGGGIYLSSISSSMELELTNTTVANNTGNELGGGIYAQSDSIDLNANVLMRNSIIANNVPLNLNAVVNAGTATIASQGFNLSNDYNGIATVASDLTGDPKLGPLALHGGSTPTRLLLGGSPALDAGNSSGSAVDQRGVARTFDIPSLVNAANGGNGADIGAVEMQALFVTNTNDANAGSLRAAITAANSNGPGLDDIVFDRDAFAAPKTINLQSALPVIDGSLTISGTGANRLTVRRDATATADFRIFMAAGSGSIAAFSGMTVSNGRQLYGGGMLSFVPLSLSQMRITGNTSFDTPGGGIDIAEVDAEILASTIDGNSGSAGGGIQYIGKNGHVLRIVNTTVSNNTGGGIQHLNEAGSSYMVVVNSTITGNSGGAGQAGSGIVSTTDLAGLSSRTELRNSIIAGNTPNNLILVSLGIGSASYLSRGFNLSSDGGGGYLDDPTDQIKANAGLFPLANNGGPTPTHALMSDSDAVDGGDNGGSGYLGDQRGSGYPRPVDVSLVNIGDGTDIGALESQFDPVEFIFAGNFD